MNNKYKIKKSIFLLIATIIVLVLTAYVGYIIFQFNRFSDDYVSIVSIFLALLLFIILDVILLSKLFRGYNLKLNEENLSVSQFFKIELNYNVVTSIRKVNNKKVLKVTFSDYSFIKVKAKKIDECFENLKEMIVLANESTDKIISYESVNEIRFAR